jgi:hypothetical protein
MLIPYGCAQTTRFVGCIGCENLAGLIGFALEAKETMPAPWFKHFPLRYKVGGA